jgi:hypothetical protein
MKNRRITEWPVEFLSRSRRTRNTIAAFLSPNAPDNRLDIFARHGKSAYQPMTKRKVQQPVDPANRNQED